MSVICVTDKLFGGNYSNELCRVHDELIHEVIVCHYKPEDVRVKVYRAGLTQKSNIPLKMNLRKHFNIFQLFQHNESN